MMMWSDVVKFPGTKIVTYEDMNGSRTPNFPSKFSLVNHCSLQT